MRFLALACSALLLLSLVGCDVGPGGGGSVHNPPASIPLGRVTPLRLEVSVWGAGSGDVARRYTDVHCRYRPENATAFTSLDGTVESEAEGRMVVVFDLPALSADDGAYVEYDFEMALDGHPNRRDVVRVPTMAPSTRPSP